MLQHNYREEAIQLINEIPHTKLKEVVEELQKFKKQHATVIAKKYKAIEDFKKAFKNVKSNSYEFMERKRAEKKLEL